MHRTPGGGDSNPIRRSAGVLRLWIALGLLVVPSGCTNPGVPNTPPRSGEAAGTVTVRGDWDDIPAAIDRAAPRAAVAPLSSDERETETTRERTVTLLAVDGQVAQVRFLGTIDPGTSPITIEAAFGEPDDPGRSAALIRLIARELESLAGRDIAPR